MQQPKAKPKKTLKVTEDQQKIWDFFTKYWQHILGFLVVVLPACFSMGWYFKGISENSKVNDLTLEYQKKIEEVKKTESTNCQEILKRYNELVEIINPKKVEKDGK